MIPKLSKCFGPQHYSHLGYKLCNMSQKTAKNEHLLDVLSNNSVITQRVHRSKKCINIGKVSSGGAAENMIVCNFFTFSISAETLEVMSLNSLMSSVRMFF